MSLGLMMHGNWDGLSMASPQLQSYKPERPVYSTPHPVQSTPTNNECKLVELRGAEVASFIIGEEEYICLPQAFDLFLKHLVGGLHTVYTKLKRLNITPVVCNVEQVRVLRGLGAIQPGVNRCKLITRKDFETLYQDCTTASRPGRPPKRYPILPPSELLSHHPGSRGINPTRGILGSPDLSNFHKRMRLDHEVNFHQQQARRLSASPTRRSPPTPRKFPSASGADDICANAANIYLQQALRHQYQQFIVNGLHNGMNPQHAPMNAALAPLIGMSNPGFFNGTIPPNLLNHINEYARNNSRDSLNGNVTNEEQGDTRSSPRQDTIPEKTYRGQSGGSVSQRYDNTSGDNLRHERKTPSREGRCSKSPTTSNHHNHAYEAEKMTDEHPLTPTSATGRDSVGDVSVSSFDSGKKSPGGPGYRQSSDHEEEVFPSGNMDQHKYSDIKTGEEKLEASGSPIQDNHDWQQASGASNISSMQTLLGNIQGLLKVAADNAKLQDKQLSFEIADLKSRITKEQELRGMIEKKLEESERIRASIQRKLNREREAVKRLQEQKLAIHDKLQPNAENEKTSGDVDVTSSPSEPHSPASHHGSNDLLQQETGLANNVQVSTTSTTPSEFSPTASSPSVISPASLGDCSAYWNSRSLVVDGSHERSSVSRSPDHSSPVNMTTTERNWVPRNLVQSSSCAK